MGRNAGDRRPRPARAMAREAAPFGVAAVCLGGLFLAWAGWETRTERRDLESLMQAHGAALAEALGHAIENAIAGNREIDDLASLRLLDTARLLDRLDGVGALNAAAVTDLTDALGLQEVQVLDPGSAALAARRELALLASGSADVLVIPPTARDDRYAAALRRTHGGVLFVAMDAGEMLAFRERTGPRSLLAAVSGSGGIVLAALDDTEGAAANRSPATSAGLTFVHPVTVAHGRTGTLRIVLSDAPLVAAERAAGRRTLAAGGAAAALTVTLAALGASRARGRRNEDEARLALERLERERRRRGQLEALGRLAATVAHEVRNPLNAVSVGVQRLARGHAVPGDEERERIVALVRSEIARLDGIVGRFLDLARPPRVAPAPGDLSAQLAAWAPLLAGAAAGAVVSIDPSRRIDARYDADALLQILLNLVKNAAEATDGRGRIAILARREGAAAVIEVRDDGPGVPAEALERAFEFGFTTKPSGSGLGLPVSLGLAAEMGGDLELFAAEGGGTVARVTLPSVEQLSEKEAP